MTWRRLVWPAKISFEIVFNSEEKCDVTLPWWQNFWITSRRSLTTTATATRTAKKQEVFYSSKTTTLHEHNAFFSAFVAQMRHEISNFTRPLYGVGEHDTKTEVFLYLDTFLSDSTPGNLDNILQIKWNWIRRVKIEIVRIHFLRFRFFVIQKFCSGSFEPRMKTLAVRSQDVLICGTNIRFEKIPFDYVGLNTKHFQILCTSSFFLNRVAKWLLKASAANLCPLPKLPIIYQSPPPPPPVPPLSETRFFPRKLNINLHWVL